MGGYYGGKQSMLSDLLPHFAIRHDIYVELFAGSAAVLLNKPRARIEVLNDLAGEISTFWRCLRDHPDELQRRIDATPPGEVALREICDAAPSDDDIEIARRWWCRTALSYGGMPTGRTNTLIQSNNFVANRRRLDAVAHRIRDIRVENTDAARLIDRVLVLSRAESANPAADPLHAILRNRP